MEEESSGFTIYAVAIAITIFCLRLYFYIRGQFRPLNLNHKHVLITGASSGLGRELAQECFMKGAKLTLIARDKLTLIDTAKKICRGVDNSGQGEYVQVFDVDISNAEKMEAVIERAENRFGEIFLCFAFAGNISGGYFLETGLNKFKEMMETNYLGTINTVMPVAKRMSKIRMGHICLVGSAHSYLPIPGSCAWAASRAAVSCLANEIRPELARYNVKVYLFSPGPMDTPGYYQHKQSCTKEIEDLEGPPMRHETVCEILLNGISAGDFHITSHDYYSFLRISSLGGLSRNHLLLDLTFSWLSVLVGHLHSLYIDFKLSRAKFKK
ncbi:TSC10 [Blepharisma stoltei]|uniref:3-dehydrosphinganine reductase n=1 Tax=Blepharisma stoltei TaxID=1481888 RepID=A0AAU9IS95_9CILI|nr:unnamed protein product [Blepharisma stoltei]